MERSQWGAPPLAFAASPRNESRASAISLGLQGCFCRSACVAQVPLSATERSATPNPATWRSCSELSTVWHEVQKVLTAKYISGEKDREHPHYLKAASTAASAARA
jgi:hypothetical protein